MTFADYAEAEDSNSKKGKTDNEESEEENAHMEGVAVGKRRIPPKTTKPRSDVVKGWTPG